MNCFLVPAPRVLSAANLNGERLAPRESRLKHCMTGVSMLGTLGFMAVALTTGAGASRTTALARNHSMQNSQSCLSTQRGTKNPGHCVTGVFFLEAWR